MGRYGASCTSHESVGGVEGEECIEDHVMAPSGHLGFIVEDCITGPDRDATEGGDDLAIELFETKQDIGLVHCLEIEVGTDHAVAVDNHTAHIGPNFWGVRGLDGSC